MKAMDSKALFDITYGLYVVSARNGEIINGQIANTVFQVTAEPITVTVSVNKQNYTHELIEKSGRFGISILSQDTPMEVIGLFGFCCGRDVNKFLKVKYKNAAGGSPVLIEHCIGYLECDLKQKVDVGTHTLFIGELSDAEVLKKDKPLTYAYYHEVKKGTAPKTAPTYRGPEAEVTEATEEQKYGPKYRCPICGYIYDPEVGDLDHNIKPGTKFEDLPDDWCCPICTASKDSFIEVQ
jgi:flavin reductase (DIM6/NTAB) family NADH-FMN oxidoreductase RutF/rubredoxin